MAHLKTDAGQIVTCRHACCLRIEVGCTNMSITIVQFYCSKLMFVGLSQRIYENVTIGVIQTPTEL